MLRWLAHLRRGVGRVVVAVLALLLGLLPVAHASGPLPSCADGVAAPAFVGDLTPPSSPFLAAYRANGPPMVGHFIYDAAGRLTILADSAVLVVVRSTYDVMGRLTGTAQDSKLCFLEIGPKDSTADGALKKKVNDAVANANRLTDQDFPPRSTSPRTYVYASYIDEPVLMEVGSGKQAKRYWIHSNHLYSVAALTDATGAEVERYRYNQHTYSIRTGIYSIRTVTIRRPRWPSAR